MRGLDFRRFYRLAILGVVLISWWVPPEIVARQQRRVDEIETENATLRGRVKALEQEVKVWKARCPE